MSKHTPTVTPGEVRRERPRVFRQDGEVHIRPGDLITLAHDYRLVLATSEHRVRATRACRKDGRPLGPWLFIFGSYRGVIRGGEAERAEGGAS